MWIKTMPVTTCNRLTRRLIDTCPVASYTPAHRCLCAMQGKGRPVCRPKPSKVARRWLRLALPSTVVSPSTEEAEGGPSYSGCARARVRARVRMCVCVHVCGCVHVYAHICARTHVCAHRFHMFMPVCASAPCIPCGLVLSLCVHAIVQGAVPTCQCGDIYNCFMRIRAVANRRMLC